MRCFIFPQYFKKVFSVPFTDWIEMKPRCVQGCCANNKAVICLQALKGVIVEAKCCFADKSSGQDLLLLCICGGTTTVSQPFFIPAQLLRLICPQITHSDATQSRCYSLTPLALLLAENAF